MSEYSVFTSESVSEGHPDKMADQVSDAILDAILDQDQYARVACETLVKTGVAMVAGEITTTAVVDYEKIIRGVINDIGYNSSDVYFDGNTCGVLNLLGQQSPDIAQGVDRAKPEDQGAGDQGLMFGYAANETDVLMPAPIQYAHRLMERQAEARKSGLLQTTLPHHPTLFLRVCPCICQSSRLFTSASSSKWPTPMRSRAPTACASRNWYSRC